MPKEPLVLSNEIIAGIEFRRCSKCRELKPRIKNGVFGVSGNTRWVDSDNKNWQGKKCAKCHSSDVNHRRLSKRHRNKDFRLRDNAKRRKYYARTGK